MRIRIKDIAQSRSTLDTLDSNAAESSPKDSESHNDKEISFDKWNFILILNGVLEGYFAMLFLFWFSGGTHIHG